jgi:16S rRNA (cytosine1402-N4)-methyltransferase
MEPIHRSVLVDEVLRYLEPSGQDSVLVDATLGEGGHSVCFLQRYPSLRVIGVDADATMVARGADRLAAYGERIEIVNAWFDEFFQIRSVHPDRVLMDLGVSMYHFVHSGRGFSFRSEEPLDMRLDSRADESAADFVNTLQEQALADLIYRYGEERLSRRIAAGIVEARTRGPIATTKELAEIIWRAVPPSYRHGRIHPATRTFQALRIAVNGELARLERGIPLVLDQLVPGGRFAIITFHSLEDRIVKHRFRDAASAGDFLVLTRKPVVPAEDEVRDNPAARSAKLRVIERSGEAA